MVCKFLYVNLHIMIHSSLQHCCHYNKNKKYASLGQMIPTLDMLMLFCVFFAFWLMDKEKNILLCTNEYNLCYNHTFKKPTCAFLSRATTAFSSASDK